LEERTGILVPGRFGEPAAARAADVHKSVAAE
jgi:hypothetical protein